MLTPVRTGEREAAREDTVSLLQRVPPHRVALLLVIALGAVLRFATLASQSFWLDEALAARELHLSFGAMLNSIASKEPNPPLFFVLEWPWTRLFGVTEAGIRSLSAVAGVAVIWLAYLCGRELVSRRAGLLAAAFAALSPFMIWYSQEGREYMLLAAFCAASLLFFVRLWREPSTRNLTWWTVFSALALATQYFAAFLVVPEALAVLFLFLFRLQRPRAGVLALGVLVLVEGALLPHLLSHVSRPAGWIGGFPLSLRIKQAAVQLALSQLFLSSATTWALLGAAVLVAVLIVLLVAGAGDRELRGAGAAAALGGVVVLLPLALAATGHDYYVARALIAAWVPLAIVVAAACTASRARAAGAVLATVVLGAFVWAQAKIDTDAHYRKSDWRTVAAALGHANGQRAVVAYDGGLAAVPLSLYLPRVPVTTPPGPLGINELDVIGYSSQAPAPRAPAGTSVLSNRVVAGKRVERLALSPSRQLTQPQIWALAEAALPPAPPYPSTSVLLQRTG